MTVDFYEMVRLLRENPRRTAERNDGGTISFDGTRFWYGTDNRDFVHVATYNLDAQYKIIEPTRKGTIEVEEVTGAKGNGRDVRLRNGQVIAVYEENIEWQE
jgi:hypothetical protein